MTRRLREIRFEKTTGGSNKFYEIVLEHDEHSGQYWVTRHWGRIGTAGQRARDVFVDHSAAEDFVREKVGKRMDRGYVVLLDENPCASIPAPSGRPSHDYSSDKRLVASSIDFMSDLSLMRAVDGVTV